MTDGMDAPTAEHGGPPAPGRQRFPGIRSWRVIGAALLLVAAALAVWYLVDGGSRHGEVTVDLAPPATVHAVGGFVVDLKPDGGRPHFLRLAIAVEVEEADLPVIEAQRARIIDAVRTKLRDYRHEDLIGADGADRLRHDILVAVNRVIAPVRVRRVLFEEFLLD